MNLQKVFILPYMFTKIDLTYRFMSVRMVFCQNVHVERLIFAPMCVKHTTIS